MIYEMYEQDVLAYAIFGLAMNFIVSIAFGMYLTKNIGIEDMMKTKGDKEQSFLVAISIFVPYAKMLITLYRVAILQLFFLNRGYTHKEFWVYLTTKQN